MKVMTIFRHYLSPFCRAYRGLVEFRRMVTSSHPLPPMTWE